MTGTRDRATVAAMVDHTLLAPEATDDDVAALCREATALGVAAVCVSPARLPLPVAVPDDVGVAAVIGFPSGAHVLEVKADEARRAVAAGATELDVVIDLAAAVEGRFDDLAAEVAAVRSAVGAATLKVIVESAVLGPLGGVLEDVCRAVVGGGADMVKTSTGFHPAGGATVEEVVRMRAAVGQDVGVKASGGIRDWSTAVAMIDAGATRLGCSATAAILAGADR